VLELNGNKSESRLIRSVGTGAKKWR